jgi:hypothetical protein
LPSASPLRGATSPRRGGGTGGATERRHALKKSCASAERKSASGHCQETNHIKRGGFPMGRGILLWLLGVPIPVIILILLFWR